MRYEDAVTKVCNGDSWRNNQSERDGGYGVACVIAYMRGTNPRINDMANHLGLSPDEIAGGFGRLYRAGAFNRWNLRKDDALLRQRGETQKEKDEEFDRAWAHIAGIAGGLIGVN